MRAGAAIGAAFLAMLAVSSSAMAQEVHYPPRSGYTRSTRPLLQPPSARSTSRPTPSLTRSCSRRSTTPEHRGVVIRIVLDPRERHDFVKLDDLSDNVRIKLRLHRRRPSRAPSRSPRSTIADGRRPAHFV